MAAMRVSGRGGALAALGGLTAGLFFMTVLTGSFGGLILEAMASLPLFAVAFGIGIVPAVAAGLLGSILVGLAAGMPFGVAFAIQMALPVGVITGMTLVGPAMPQARRPVLALAGLGAVFFGLACLAYIGQPGGLEAAIKPKVAEVWRQAMAQRPDLLDITPEVAARWVAAWVPGVAIAVWLLTLAANAALAQSALQRFGRNLRPTPLMSGLDLPRWVSPVFAGLVVVACVGKGEIGFAGRNLAVIAAVPLLLGGLAVIHMLVRRHPARLMILVGVYVFVFGLGWPAVLLVILGVIEQWVGLRQRIAAGPRRGEE